MGTSAPLSRLTSGAHPKVAQAADFSKKYLSRIRRSSGDTYYRHGIEVAVALEEVTNDPSLIATGILHDILVHPDGQKLLDASPLEDEDRKLVRMMHDLRHLHIDVNTKDLDRVIEAFTQDGRLLLLRMAHRLNDVRNLGRFVRQRRREIAHETLYMYTAISGRLGFQRWRWQMEDVCFMELQPRIAKRMKKQFDACARIDRACLDHTRLYLQEKLLEAGIEASIDERIKGLYSTYRKMVLKKRGFEELTDRLALRVLVDDPADCYAALGVVHATLRPMHGKLKDYIGTPKENGYRSIHTIVYPMPGVTELPIEIQIRTHAMQRECEFGFASHGSYKDWTYSLTSADARVNLFRNLENLHSVTRADDTFTESLRKSFRDDKLLIFDPDNVMHHIDRPATALDFACQAHPRAWHTIAGVRINGRARSLATALRDGDTVEVIHGTAPLHPSKLLHAAQQKATREMIRKFSKNASGKAKNPITKIIQ